MERLTEKTIGCFEYRLKDHKPIPREFGTYEAFFDYSMAVRALGKYEDAEEQGLLIRLPCKVGDTVYEANAVRKIVSTYKVTSIIIMTGSKNYGWELMDGVYSNVNGFNEYALGKSVFLNREAAEEALKELEG